MSNGPLCNTGYGSVSRNVLFRLSDMGYDKLDCLAYYGAEGVPVTHRGVTIFPRQWHTIGRDSLELLLKHRAPDILFALFDSWVTVEPDGSSWVTKNHKHCIWYAPVDHEPMPRLVYMALKPAYKVVAMSQSGERLMRQAGLNPTMIPHGVDTNIFKPLNRNECRAKQNISELPFIIGINAMNKGPRKSFPEMFSAFQMAANKIGGPDKIRLYMNCDLRQPEGMDLQEALNRFDIAKYTITTHPYARYCGITDREMAEWYNCCDLFMLTSRGEGFGLPVLEAEACGVPVVATDFTTMSELVKGHGWLVKPRAFDMTGLISWQAIPNVDEAANAIVEAYNDQKLLRQHSAACVDFAKDYDYDRVIVPKWDKFFRETFEEIKSAPKQQQQEPAKI